MSTAFSRLYPEQLLEDSCTLASYTSESEDSTSLERTGTWGTGAAVACCCNSPSNRWRTTWPLERLAGSLEFWLPPATAVKPKDKITYQAVDYFVMDVRQWAGAALAVLAERVLGGAV